MILEPYHMGKYITLSHIIIWIRGKETFCSGNKVVYSWPKAFAAMTDLIK